MSKSEFEYLKSTKTFIATTSVGNNEYGIHECFCNKDVILVINIELIEQLKKNTDFDITTIYIKTTDEQRRERLQKRGASKEEIEEKIARNSIYQDMEEKYADYVVENNELEETIKKIQDIVEMNNNDERERFEIIDAHSHIGYDYIFGNSDINDYVEFCRRNKITKGNVMPQPNPVYHINGRIVPCISLKYIDGKIQYDTYNHNNENPYEYINYYYYMKCMSIKDFDINFIPLVHPILDTTEYLEKLISGMHPNALKIHGIGSGISPNDIPDEFVQIVRKYDLPIIVHVECDTRSNTNHTEQKRYMKRVNNAYDWAEFLVDNGLRGLLTHGLALDKRAIDLVKDNRGIMIGIGPDLLISNQPHRLKIQGDSSNYLKMLKENISPDQIVFDIDFNWNINPKTGEIDNESVERIKQVWQDRTEQRKIFSENAKILYSGVRITERKGESR